MQRAFIYQFGSICQGHYNGHIRFEPRPSVQRLLSRALQISEQSPHHHIQDTCPCVRTRSGRLFQPGQQRLHQQSGSSYYQLIHLQLLQLLSGISFGYSGSWSWTKLLTSTVPAPLHDGKRENAYLTLATVSDLLHIESAKMQRMPWPTDSIATVAWEVRGQSGSRFSSATSLYWLEK